MVSCRSDTSEKIKAALTMRQVAGFYGFDIDRGGYIKCPFHSGDNHGSLKIYPDDKGWYCFGCHQGGDVISFVAKLFNLKYPAAMLRICSDFGMNVGTVGCVNKRPSEALKMRQKEAEEKAAIDAEYRIKAIEYRRCMEAVIYFPPVLLPDGGVWIHPEYEYAVKKMPELEYWLDENIGR